MRFSLVGLAVVIVDQVTKAWISYALTPGETRMVIPGLLHLTYVYNPGAAFGLLQSQQLLLTIIAIAVLLYAWFQRRLIRQQSFAMRLGITLGLSGAVGNTIDRIWRGAVLDFVDVPWIPVFNVADTAIVIGVIIIFAVILLQPDEPARAEEHASTDERGAGTRDGAGTLHGHDGKG